MKPIVYLDNSATTKPFPEVIETIINEMEHNYANASSTYTIGRKAKSKMELTRKYVATQLGVSSSEIIFTSGGTEANNWILQTAIRDLEIRRIITSKIEHHAVLKTIEKLAKRYDVAVDYVSFDEDGDVSIDSVEELLIQAKQQDQKKTLVSLMHINNEIGTILDLARLGEICETYGALFHTDTVQSIGHFELDLGSAKVHFATASAHKFHGAKGVGFAYVKKGLRISASQYGGEQERGLRAGTESVSLILGMRRALELSYKNLVKNTNYISGLKAYAVDEISKAIPLVKFNANSNAINRNYNLLNICLPVSNDKATTVLFQLDLVGICCSRGSACQSGSNKPSHVLKVVSSKEDLKFTSLRFSFSIYNTKKDIDYLVAQLKKIIN